MAGAAGGAAAGGGMVGVEQELWAEPIVVGASSGVLALHAVLLADVAPGGLRVRRDLLRPPADLRAAAPRSDLVTTSLQSHLPSSQMRLSSRDEPRLLHSTCTAGDAGRQELSAQLRPGRYTLALVGSPPRLPARWPAGAAAAEEGGGGAVGGRAALEAQAGRVSSGLAYGFSLEVWPLCRDANPSCAAWARRGECTKKPAFMLRSCRLSCRVCSAAPAEIEGDHAEHEHLSSSASASASAGAAPGAGAAPSASLSPMAPHCHEATELASALAAGGRLLAPGAPLRLSGRFAAPRVAGSAAAQITVPLPPLPPQKPGGGGGATARRVLHVHARAEVAGDGVLLRLVDTAANYTTEVASGAAEAAGLSLGDANSDEVWRRAARPISARSRRRPEAPFQNLPRDLPQVWAELASYSAGDARFALVIAYVARPAAAGPAACRRLRVQLSLHAATPPGDEWWDLDRDEEEGLGLAAGGGAGAGGGGGGAVVSLAHPAVGGCTSERLPPPHYLACCGGERQYDAAAAARLLRHELGARAAALCVAKARPRSLWSLEALRSSLPRLEGLDEARPRLQLPRTCRAGSPLLHPSISCISTAPARHLAWRSPATGGAHSRALAVVRRAVRPQRRRAAALPPPPPPPRAAPARCAAPLRRRGRRGGRGGELCGGQLLPLLVRVRAAPRHHHCCTSVAPPLHLRCTSAAPHCISVQVRATASAASLRCRARRRLAARLSPLRMARRGALDAPAARAAAQRLRRRRRDRGRRRQRARPLRRAGGRCGGGGGTRGRWRAAPCRRTAARCRSARAPAIIPLTISPCIAAALHQHTSPRSAPASRRDLPPQATMLSSSPSRRTASPPRCAAARASPLPRSSTATTRWRAAPPPRAPPRVRLSRSRRRSTHPGCSAPARRGGCTRASMYSTSGASPRRRRGCAYARRRSCACSRHRPRTVPTSPRRALALALAPLLSNHPSDLRPISAR